ncbi:class I SAM-dependent methyltransferase [candidate division KSB1 bacterium]
MSSICTLCNSRDVNIFHSLTNKFGKKDFLLCGNCDLIFVPPEFHPAPDIEKKRYDLHENDQGDMGYKKHLQDFEEIVSPYIDRSIKGLDFGCGPYPLLADIFREKGYTVDIYDPFFFNDPGILNNKFDFITCTETIEHFRDPNKEFHMLNSLLISGGILCIMTGIVENRDDFPDWHYIQDITHLAFYSKQTLGWIAENFDWNILYSENDVIVFEKN